MGTWGRLCQWGCKLALCAALAMPAAYAAPALTERAGAFEDTGAMSDEVFFGEWDAGAGSWLTEGKLNYGHSAGLSNVESAVKLRDYTLAKQELLDYYRGRSGHGAFPLATTGTFLAELVADNILTAYSEYAESQFTVGSSFATVSADVTGGVRSVATVGGRELNLYLMGRHKDDELLAQFYSREQTSNKPVLELVVDGSPLAPIVASKDTYTRPGQTVKYGTSTLLEVQDSGLAATAPFDSNTRRTFLSFELPVISGTVDSATIKLHGKSSAGTMDILVIRTDASWGEAVLDWQTQASNTFSWQGVPDGPDWLQPSSGAFNEYYWLINRFQFIGPLAAAYSNSVADGTPNESFAGHTIRLMLDYIGSDFGTLQPHNYTRSLDVSFRGIVWPRLLDILWASPSLDAEALAAILKNLWQTADWLAYDPAGFTGFNWAVNESKGLYATAAYLPEFADASGWRSVAERRLEGLLSTLMTLDGGYAEPSYNYSWVSLASFYDIKRISDLNGAQISPSFRTGILKLARYLMDMTLPNGYDPVYGDGHYSNFSATLKMIGNDLGDPELIYAGSVGDPIREGTEPEHTSAYYPDNKSVMLRSGWQPDDRYLLFTNSAGPHGHADQNAVIAYAYGKVLLTDTGVNSYLSSNPVSAWQFNNTESHNTVRINGLLQSKYHNISGVNKDTIDRFSTNGYFDYAEGTTYSTPGFAHTRSVLFLRPNYWIVSDYVTGGDGGANAIEQNWHFLPGANPVINPTTKAIQTQYIGEPNIQLVPADPGTLTVAELRDGYYDRTDTYNAKFGKYSKTSTGDVSFDTVLMPTDTGESRDVQVTRLAMTPSVAPTKASALRIELDAGAGGNTAYYYLSHEPGANQERQYGDYSYDGKMAYVEETAGGELAGAAIAGGATLKQDGQPLIQSEEPVGDLALRWTDSGTALEIDGGSLVLDSSPTTAIAIYAPNASAVKVNGMTVSYMRQGDYVYAVRAATVETTAEREFTDRQGAGGWSYMKDSGSGATPLVWSQSGNGAGTGGSDSFSATSLDDQWAWAGTPTASWSLNAAPGKLRIVTESGDTWGGSNNQKNILLQQPLYPDYVAETKVSFANTSNYQAAGLILYVDDDNYIKLDRAFNSANGGKIIRLVREYRTNPLTEFRDGGLYVADTFGTGDVYFRLRKKGDVISAYYSGDGTTWAKIGGNLHIPLKAPRIGLHAMNTNASLTAAADFDYFNVTQLLPDNWSGNGGDPVVAKDYTQPGQTADAVRQWEAPAAGTLTIDAAMSSHSAYTGGDGFRVKVTRNGASVWPSSGWQEVAPGDTAGYSIVETINVAKGDKIAFVTSSGAAGDAAYDAADWSIRLMLAPGFTAWPSRFADSGEASDWVPLTAGRWTVAPGGGAGGNAYTLTATGYAAQSGGRPGEYALRTDESAQRYRLTLKAKLGDDVATQPNASAVVLFDYLDADNYYFARLDNAAAEVRLYKVKEGVATPLAGSDSTDWLNDNHFHAVSLYRDGRTGEIEVRLDDKAILRAWDREFRGGQFGVGSMEGSAAFDDVTLVNLADRTDSFEGATMHPDWQWVREEPDYWSLSAVPGKLRITAVTQSDIWKTSNTQTNLLGKTSPYEDFALTTEIAYGPLANYQSAGLLAYVDDNHYVKVERVYNSAHGGAVFRIVRENGELNAVTLTAPDTLGSAPVHLKLVKQGANFTGYYSVDGATWTQIGSSALTYAVSGPMRVGLHAQRSAGAAPVPADFSYFRLAPAVEGDRLSL
ncbi:DUF1349 domain-containing protein [Paenibacillus agaridevorans]|uniref:beta-xylosidase family glycoside hydrolase n=1 Tax=Paenibacillus agaridevorans TaxID=171404 RepID=UPI001BE4895D|nr:DUF1349 domain-containing protein [Paenibacillus agaridevorans]